MPENTFPPGKHPNTLRNLRPIKPGQRLQGAGRPSRPFEERARVAARKITTEAKGEYYAPLVRTAVADLQKQIERRIAEEHGTAAQPGSEGEVETGLIRGEDEADPSAYRGRLTGIMARQLMSECQLSKDGETWESLIVLRTLTLALKGNGVALREVWTRMEGRVDQRIIGEMGGAPPVDPLADLDEEEVNKKPWTVMLKERYKRRLASGMDETEASAVPVPEEKTEQKGVDAPPSAVDTPATPVMVPVESPS